jgi:predicted PurR-regulated permease PerM
VGAELAGILGALAAIPVAGALQVLLRDWLAHRQPEVILPAASAEPPA